MRILLNAAVLFSLLAVITACETMQDASYSPEWVSLPSSGWKAHYRLITKTGVICEILVRHPSNLIMSGVDDDKKPLSAVLFAENYLGTKTGRHETISGPEDIFKREEYMGEQHPFMFSTHCLRYIPHHNLPKEVSEVIIGYYKEW